MSHSRKDVIVWLFLEKADYVIDYVYMYLPYFEQYIVLSMMFTRVANSTFNSYSC